MNNEGKVQKTVIFPWKRSEGQKKNSLGLEFVPFKRQGLALMPKLECSDTIIVHRSLTLLGSSNPPTSTSQVAGTQAHTTMHG